MRLSLTLLLLATFAGSPSSRLVTTGSAGIRAVALTFDAGADRGFAAQILSDLESSHVRASFGMTGTWAEQNPDLIRRMARDGDTFINHTYDHRSFTGYSTHAAPLTAAQRGWEVWKTETIVERIAHRTTKPYFRPPFGDYDAATLTEVWKLGYRYTVMWTVDSLGWEGLPAAEILRRCTALLAPGAIYLMHVGSQSQDAAALPGLLKLLRSRHYRVVPVPQLLEAH